MSIHVLRPHIAEPKYDNAGQIILTCSHQVAKIQVMGEQNSLFVKGPPQNVWIAGCARRTI
jgi:hypothetical protein